MDKAIAWFTKLGERNLALAVMVVFGATIACLWIEVVRLNKEGRESEIQHRRELVECKEQAKQEVTKQYEARIGALEGLLAKLDEKTVALEERARKLKKR